jgi:hypothetical protein
MLPSLNIGRGSKTIPSIGKLVIKNSAAYFIYPRVSWRVDAGGHEATQVGEWAMLVTNEDFLNDPGDAGCPSGAIVWPYLGVVGGPHNP